MDSENAENVRDWQPTASHEVIRLRAAMLKSLREFFEQRDVLEVETPQLSSAANPDPNIESFLVTSDPDRCNNATKYLHTSPEFAMKRLLASGLGSIYQVCKVFRCGESGKNHNPEFTMLEWYRSDMGYLELMDEVEALITKLLTFPATSEKFTIQYAFQECCGIDILNADVRQLADAACNKARIDVMGLDDHDWNGWFHLLLDHVIQPWLQQYDIAFLYEFPQSQAALAKIKRNDQGLPIAQRFECYIRGLEIANGYQELLDAQANRARFEREIEMRRRWGQSVYPLDEKFLQALEQGLPVCSGVALGLDRLLMVKSNAQSLDNVISFPWSIA